MIFFRILFQYFSNYFQSIAILSIRIISSETSRQSEAICTYFLPYETEFNMKRFDLCKHYLAVFLFTCKVKLFDKLHFVALQKICWSKSNLRSRCDFKSFEDKKQTFALSLWINCQNPPHFTCYNLSNLIYSPSMTKFTL